MMLATMLALATPGRSPIAQRVDHLRCGDADLRMTSSVLADRTAPLAPVDQTLTRRVGGRAVPVPLERPRSVVLQGHRIQDRYVSSWACIKGQHQTSYVLIGYACAADLGGADDCAGEKEWFRLLDTRGRFADTGVPHDGPARDRLNARLGIADVMAAGVSMTPVVE